MVAVHDVSWTRRLSREAISKSSRRFITCDDLLPGVSLHRSESGIARIPIELIWHPKGKSAAILVSQQHNVCDPMHATDSQPFTVGREAEERNCIGREIGHRMAR